MTDKTYGGLTLDEIEALEKAATVGSWCSDHVSTGGFVIEGPDRVVLCQRPAWPHRAEESNANGRLIVAMRNALLALLARVREADASGKFKTCPGCDSAGICRIEGKCVDV